MQTARLADGGRKITQISEVTGFQGEAINMHDIFVFEQTGVGAKHEVEGTFQATGIRPMALARLQKAGITLPADLFARGSRATDRFTALGLKEPRS